MIDVPAMLSSTSESFSDTIHERTKRSAVVISDEPWFQQIPEVSKSRARLDPNVRSEGKHAVVKVGMQQLNIRATGIKL